MSGLLYTLLALLTTASALAVVLARRPLWAGLALGLNMASLAGIALTLSTPLVAIALVLVGLGIALVSLMTFGRDCAAAEEPNAPAALCNKPCAENEAPAARWPPIPPCTPRLDRGGSIGGWPLLPPWWRSRQHPDRQHLAGLPPGWRRSLFALAGELLGLILLIGLASALLAGDAPGWLSREASGATDSAQAAVVMFTALFTRYSLGLVGLGLVIVAALIGIRCGKGEC